MSDASTLPERPRLASSVHARLHVIDGETKVILHDVRREIVLEIDERSWQVLAEADGTRDLDALALAAARRGLFETEADLVRLLGELHAAGVLEDGLAAPIVRAPVEAPPETPLDRPLEPLPDFALSCDGSGSCCRFYGSVGFTALEAMRARVVADEMVLPISLDRAFTPLRGAQQGDEPRAVALVDGRCLFLEDDLCGLHARGGPSRKPFPCRFYPAMLMDDGVSVRVSLGPECACVFDSALGGVGVAGGEPLVPSEARVVRDLPPDVALMRVPDPVPLSRMRTTSPRALHAWSDLVCETLRTREVDAVAFAWSLAGAVREGDLTVPEIRPPAVEALAPWWDTLGAWSRDAAAARTGWRSASDLSRRVAEWIATALAAVRLRDALVAPHDARAERFYLRALAHGHRLAVEGRPVDHGLCDRKIRLLAARAMGAVEPPADVSARWPLALLEAAMRNLGLAGYADDLG
jgi:lysine-N-methylase